MDDAPILARQAASELRRRADAALARLAACTLCARRCGADRTRGIHRATCRTGAQAAVASWGAVEDDPLLGGTAGILFAGCNLRCLACSTWAASWDGAGDAVDADGLEPDAQNVHQALGLLFLPSPGAALRPLGRSLSARRSGVPQIKGAPF